MTTQDNTRHGVQPEPTRKVAWATDVRHGEIGIISWDQASTKRLCLGVMYLCVREPRNRLWWLIFCQLDTNQLSKKKEHQLRNGLAFNKSVGNIFLVNDRCGRDLPPLPPLGTWFWVTKESTLSQRSSMILLWFLPLACCRPCTSVMNWNCNTKTNPSLLTCLFVLVFITTTESKLKTTF